MCNFSASYVSPTASGVSHPKNFQEQLRTSDQRSRECIGDVKRTYFYTPQACLQRPGPLRYLRDPNSSNSQWELRAFVLLSKDQGSHHSSLGPPDLRVMVRLGDIELLD